MGSALAVESGCSLLQRSGLIWLFWAMTDAHSASSLAAEGVVQYVQPRGFACEQHVRC